MHISFFGVNILLIPIFTSAILFVLWWFYGRDKTNIDVIRFKLPDFIDPAEAAAILNDTIDNSAFISLFYYWADKGYLKIVETETEGLIAKKRDFFLIKVSDLPYNARNYERIIFYGLFPHYSSTVLISSLKNDFYQLLNQARIELDAQLSDEALYEPAGQCLGAILCAISISLSVISLFIGLNNNSLSHFFVLITTSMIIYLFSTVMPKKTSQGVAKFEMVLGFKHFLEKAEMPVFKKMFKHNPCFFSKIIPYAVAFGLVDELTKKFSNLNVEIPQWMITSGSNFNSIDLFTLSITDSYDALITLINCSD